MKKHKKREKSGKRYKPTFPELEIESFVDHDQIKHVREVEGILDERYSKGKMSREVASKMSYVKAEHRSGLLVKDWSDDKYF